MKLAAFFRNLAAVWVLFLSGCAPVLNLPATIDPGQSELTETVPSPTFIVPTRYPAPSPTLVSTQTAPATAVEEIENPLCPQPLLEAYLALVDPLGAGYLQDAKLAQDAAGLEAGQREEYQRQAQARLEQLAAITPPDCASQFHQKVIGSFTGLIQSWEAAQEGRFDESQEILRVSYELFAEAAAILAGYKPLE